jgi:general secretion pathway protein H
VRDHPTLTEYRFDGALRLRVEETRPVAPEAAARAALYPAIWFDPAGMTEPFRLRLSADDGAEIELDWQAAGRIERTARG